jgi:hypothetical protein
MLSAMRVLWVTLLLAGCMDELPHEDPTNAARRGPCSVLEDRSFNSVEQAECGLGPNGPVACNWQITFLPADGTKTRYEWGHSDVAESGYVTCDGDAIRSDEATLYEGHFSTQLDLIWDDVAYILSR